MNIKSMIAAVVVVVACACASAHVTVWPRESRPGAHEKYTVRGPTEGKVATSSIEVFVPEGVTVVSMAAPTGYTYDLRRAGDRVTSILFSMRIEPGEFAEFAFMARNPKEPGDLAWKATQRFIDGTSTEWTGPRGDKHPASVTTLNHGEQTPR
jgi:uncharacterized protein YcnI